MKQKGLYDNNLKVFEHEVAIKDAVQNKVVVPVAYKKSKTFDLDNEIIGTRSVNRITTVLYTSEDLAFLKGKRIFMYYCKKKDGQWAKTIM